MTVAPVELSICIPAYREAESLLLLLPALRLAAAALTEHFEIVVVDTQQTMDHTREVCVSHGVRYLARSGGDSFGDAMRTIVQQARGRYILCMDADGSHDPSALGSLWAERERYDIVIGSRYVTGGQTDNPFALFLMSYLLNLTFRLAFSIHVKDLTNSFRLYHREVLTPLQLESNDFDILEEILVKASVLNPQLRLGEVPVTFRRRQAGESKRKLLKFAIGYGTTLRRLRRFARVTQGAVAKREETSSL